MPKRAKYKGHTREEEKYALCLQTEMKTPFLKTWTEWEGSALAE